MPPQISEASVEHLVDQACSVAQMHQMHQMVATRMNMRATSMNLDHGEVRELKLAVPLAAETVMTTRRRKPLMTGSRSCLRRSKQARPLLLVEHG